MGNFTHRDVCTAFAKMATTLEPPDPRIKAERVFIDGRCLYSYGKHHVIARITTRRRVMVNTKKFSSSTSRHTSYAVQAFRKAGVDVTECDFRELKPTTQGPRALEL